MSQFLSLLDMPYFGASAVLHATGQEWMNDAGFVLREFMVGQKTKQNKTKKQDKKHRLCHVAF